MIEDTSDISKKLVILEEIAGLISRSHELQDTLDQICRLVTSKMGFEVCSIYLLDGTRQMLILRATQGLDPKAVGKVTMAIDEGITGLAVEELRPVAVSDASEHERYKYFPETHEERYQSLLASPIVEKGRAIGVINVQTLTRYEFSPDDVRVMNSIAAQVAVIVQNYRLLQAITKHRVPVAIGEHLGGDGDRPEAAADSRQEFVLRGIPISPGISMGRAVVHEPHHAFAQLFEVRPQAEDKVAEMADLDAALVAVRDQIKDAELRIAERLSDEEAKIFSTHLMILEDEGFLGKVREEIEGGFTALYAVRDVVAHYVQLFEGIEDPYIRDKISDIEDVGKRLMNALSRSGPPAFPSKGGRGARGGILVGDRVTATDVIEVDASDLLGLISGRGGMESHSAILARSFGIPAVFGIESQLRMIHDGDFLVIDGTMGNVYVNPPKHVIQEFKRARRDYLAIRHEIEEGAQGPARTRDNTRIHLMANVSLVADVKTAIANNAEGIGLYRTEFVYLTRNTFPTEEEQYKVYSKIVRQMKNQRVTIRTLDVGGDKYMPQLNQSVEDNPYLGWRSIRVSLDLLHVFKTQLRAILRASAHGKVAILFPMITSLEELERAAEVIDEVREELRAEKVAFDRRVPVGMMVEVPSAALMAEQFARLVDFFSIGSNDLTQYTLAVDRNNQRVAGLYEPLHPAVIQLIQHTFEAAREQGKETTICGELAGQPEAIPLLIGLGYRTLSMSPASLPLARYVVRALRRSDCEKIAKKAVKLSTGHEVRQFLRKELMRLNLPELVKLQALAQQPGGDSARVPGPPV